MFIQRSLRTPIRRGRRPLRQCMQRITKDIKDIELSKNLSIAVAYEDDNLRHIQAMILGPPDSPYEFGFFEFGIKISKEYPSKPPKVEAKTTNKGQTRFNPNIYAQGKVCLSILGTWQGEMPGEEWSSVHGIESVLISVQSLMHNDPYSNEPGYEGRLEDKDKQLNTAYCDKIRHETIRIAVLQKLEQIYGVHPSGKPLTEPVCDKWHKGEPKKDGQSESDSEQEPEGAEEGVEKWEPYADWQKQRFLWYFNSYLDTVDECIPKFKVGQKFEMMPFEGGANSMRGSFNYPELRERAIRVKLLVDLETEKWMRDGLTATSRDSNLAYTIRSQFQTMKNMQESKQNIANIDLELEKDNPFVWLLTYFGRPETNLDGGIFKIRIVISTKFPAEQPRVRVLTRMYHHRITRAGILCYTPEKPDDIKDHILTMIRTIEETSPPFDPRLAVHAEASKLMFGSKDEKKKYDRLQRRSAQNSTEEI